MRRDLLLGGAVIVLALAGPASAQAPGQSGGEQRQGTVQNQSSQEQGQSSQNREGRDNNRVGEQQERSERNYGERQNRRDYGERNEGREERRTVGRATDDRYRGDRDFDRDSRRYEERNRYEGRERFGDRDRYEGRERYGDRDRFEERGQYGERRNYDRRYGRLERENDRGISRRQRARIRDVLVQRRVQPANIDFPVRIGARIPGYVETYDLPREVFEWAPNYDGYRYFETEDQIIIVDPDTMEVVAVLDQ